MTSAADAKADVGNLIAMASGDHNGTAKLLATVLREKLTEARWKPPIVQGLGRKVVSVELPDRGDRVVIEGGFGILGVRSGDGPAADLALTLPAKSLPLLLKVSEGTRHIPALWGPGGRALLSALGSRTVRVKGAVRHPLLLVRVLQLLSVPKAARG
jgi:hypothetical protein